MEHARFFKSSSVCWGRPSDIALMELLHWYPQATRLQWGEQGSGMTLVRFFSYTLEPVHLWAVWFQIQWFLLWWASSRELLLKHDPRRLVPECGVSVSWFLAPLQRRWELRARCLHLHNAGCHYVVTWDLVGAFIKQGGIFNIPTIISPTVYWVNIQY